MRLREGQVRLAQDPAAFLEVAEEVPEVDVEEVAVGLEHDVGWMAVAAATTRG